MFNLKWLILCLLVSFKSFSQIDTPVVILTEDQAKLVVKDLIQFDNLKLITKQLEDRIYLFEQKEIDFISRLKSKDGIISSQGEYLATQEKLKTAITNAEAYQVTLKDPMLFGEVTLGLNKIDIGARIFVQPNYPSGFGIVVRYKIF